MRIPRHLTAWLVLASGAALAQGLIPGLDVEGPQGERGSQPVAGADPSAELEVVLLPQGDRTQVGQPFRFDVTVVGDPVRAAANVRLEIGASIRRGQAQAPATELRIERAVAVAAAGQPESPCTGTGDTRACDIALLPAKGEAKASFTIRTRANAAPGQVLLSARALIGGAPKAAQEALVELAERIKLSEVDLRVQVKGDSDVGAPGLDIGNTVTVRNMSKVHDATDVVVAIRQRAAVSEAEGFKRLGDEAFTTTGRGPNCERRQAIYRCAVGTLRPEAEATIFVESKIAAELPARRWGRLETQARVKSAEGDPNPANNFARDFTNLISPQPELAFLSVARGTDGRGRFMRQDSLANRQIVALAARYPNVLVEPGEVVVRLRVDNGAPVDVRLRPRADGKDRVYRSDPFIVLAPQDGTDTGGTAPLRAARGSVVKLMLGRSEIAIRVE